MKKEEFMQQILQGAVRKRIADSLTSLLKKPDYPRFSDKLKDCSKLYDSLTNDQKKTYELTMRYLVDSVLYHVCMAFSEQSIGKIREDGGRLILYYQDENGNLEQIVGEAEDDLQLFELLHAAPDFPDWILEGIIVNDSCSDLRS